MNTRHRVPAVYCSLVALVLLVASSPLGGAARSAALVGIQPDSPALRHMFIPAVGFRAPTPQVTPYYPDDFSCWYSNQGGNYVAPLLLPEGSTIKYLTINFIDNNPAHNITAYLTVVAGPNSFTELGSVASSGSSGIGTATSTELSVGVDMATQSYLFRLNMPMLTAQFCGLRIDYIPPSIFAIALPHVAR